MSQVSRVNEASDSEIVDVKKKEAFVKSVYHNASEYLTNSLEEHVGAFAAQTAFFIFLSIFPLIGVILSLTQYLPISYEELCDFIADNIPLHFQGVILQIFNEIYHDSTRTSTVISVVVALWSAAKGMMAVRNCLNEIYRARDRRNYFINRFLSMIYTFIMVIIMILIIFLNVFGERILSFIHTQITHLANETWYLFDLRGPITFLIMFLLLLFLYTFTPNRKLKMQRQIPGAILASLGWVIMSKMFSYVVNYYLEVSKVYGSLTTVVLIMLWMYSLGWLLYIGAMLNEFIYEYYIYPKRYLRPYTRDRYNQNLKSENPAYSKVIKYTKEKFKKG